MALALPDVKEHIAKHDLRASSTKASFILPEYHHDANESDDEDDFLFLLLLHSPSFHLSRCDWRKPYAKRHDFRVRQP